MPKSLAEAKVKLTVLTVKPADPNAVTAAEATAGKDIQCRIAYSDYKLGATASDTVDDKELCARGNAKTPGNGNFEGSVTPFRYFDTTSGKAETGTGGEVGDYAFQTLKTKGTRVWMLERFTSKDHDLPWVAGDEYNLYEVLTDEPQPASLEGYIKRTIPLLVQNAWTNKAIAGAV